jgi:hypothetical protein
VNTRLIIADASRVSGADFFAAVTGKPPRTAAERARDGELAQAAIEHSSAMAKAPRGRSAYWERERYRDECRSAYAARCREIEERYAEQLTEVHSDPFLKASKAA